MNKIAKFNVGDLVTHRRQGYRAVIVDIDPLFQASGQYNPQACKRSFSKNNPWYRLWVDGSSLITYVEEPLLAADPHQHTIDHPNLHDYLIKKHGSYCSNASRH